MTSAGPAFHQSFAFAATGAGGDAVTVSVGGGRRGATSASAVSPCHQPATGSVATAAGRSDSGFHHGSAASGVMVS